MNPKGLQSLAPREPRMRPKAAIYTTLIMAGMLAAAPMAIVPDSAHAATLENTINWDNKTYTSSLDWNTFTSSDKDPVTYTPIIDIGNLFTYSWTQTIDFFPNTVTIDSATVYLTHKGNADKDKEWSLKGEIWVLSVDGNDDRMVETLEFSNNKWVTQDFQIDKTLLEGFSGTSITFALKLYETTQWIDVLWLDKSVITGNFTQNAAPVPIPGTALLLGTCLLGLVGIGSRRKLR